MGLQKPDETMFSAPMCFLRGLPGLSDFPHVDQAIAYPMVYSMKLCLGAGCFAGISLHTSMGILCVWNENDAKGLKHRHRVETNYI
jgi:hypothetical protein